MVFHPSRTSYMAGNTNNAWHIEVFFDGECPLCRKEINMLRWMDRRDRIRFTDIANSGFFPQQHGRSMQQFMDEIQGRLPDGTWITGVEVFRRLYAAVGFWWITGLTRLPVISHALDWGYRKFAKNRLRWTGRCRAGSCQTPV